MSLMGNISSENLFIPKKVGQFDSHEFFGLFPLTIKLMAK